jgi:hypothetical protein
MQIKIGAITYDIVEEKGLTNGDKDAKLDGHIRYSECQICVEAGLAGQAKRQVIWHEVIHGILTHAGIRKHDEALVDALAYGLMDLLKNNPWLAGETPVGQ